MRARCERNIETLEESIGALREQREELTQKLDANTADYKRRFLNLEIMRKVGLKANHSVYATSSSTFQTLVS